MNLRFSVGAEWIVIAVAIGLLGVFFPRVALSAEQVTLPDKLRVCSDPNNLPFSDKKEQGFENKIASLLADSLGLELEYTWFPQRMGFIRNTLKSWSDTDGRFKCDLVMGVPQQFDMTDTTSTYYRSSYVLVYKKGGKLAKFISGSHLMALPEAVKPGLVIGTFAPSPAVNWLRHRDLFDQARIYRMMSGDPDYYPGKLIEEDLIGGDIDGAIIWGPIAGYFAGRFNADTSNLANPLQMTILKSEDDAKFDFAISMGIRHGEKAWKTLIEKTLQKNKTAIQTILNEYQVPLL